MNASFARRSTRRDPTHDRCCCTHRRPSNSDGAVSSGRHGTHAFAAPPIRVASRGILTVLLIFVEPSMFPVGRRLRSDWHTGDGAEQRKNMRPAVERCAGGGTETTGPGVDETAETITAIIDTITATEPEDRVPQAVRRRYYAGELSSGGAQRTSDGAAAARKERQWEREWGRVIEEIERVRLDVYLYTR